MLGHVVRAGLESSSHLNVFTITIAKFEHSDFVCLADLREHHGEVAESLQPRLFYRQRYVARAYCDLGCHGHTWAPTSLQVRDADAGNDALAAAGHRQQSLNLSAGFGLPSR